MAEKGKILIVDDQESMRKSMTGILKMEGYEVCALENGYKAIEKVKEISFDVAFLDIKMPGINGVETFKEIKKTSPETVVFMMTAYAVEDLIEEALKEGAYAVINKPFDIEPMLDKIKKIKEEILVLVVDDQTAFRNSLSLNLKKEGYRVIFASSGEEAIKFATRRPADVVLMDIMMEGMNGVETFKKIKEIVPKEKEPVTIMMSGYEANDKVKEALSLGVKTFLKKPLSIEDLEKTIKRFIDKTKVPAKKEKISILIVDDEISTINLFSDILNRHGYDVRTAANGSQAIDEIKRDHFKVILLDVKLPDINGIKIYEEIKKIKPEISVIMMTDYSKDEAVTKAIEKGEYTYLYKPFEPEKMLEIVRKVCQLK